MRRLSVAGTVLVVLLNPLSARAQPSVGNRDLGTEVRSMFARKCAGCHGADLPKPQGRFGYVLDLRRIAGNPEMVIPGKPDQSELWMLVSHGDMPPADSPRGPLTTTEKEIVREWIAAGAPDVRPVASGVANTPPEQESLIVVPPLSAFDRTIRFLGKFHLLLLHFPLALLLAAVIGEVLALWRGMRKPSLAARFCLTLAAIFVGPDGRVWLVSTLCASGNGPVVAQQLLDLPSLARNGRRSSSDRRGVLDSPARTPRNARLVWMGCADDQCASRHRHRARGWIARPRARLLRVVTINLGRPKTHLVGANAVISGRRPKMA